jgi:hypothetical protein
MTEQEIQLFTEIKCRLKDRLKQREKNIKFGYIYNRRIRTPNSQPSVLEDLESAIKLLEKK